MKKKMPHSRSSFRYLYFDFDGVMTNDLVLLDESGREFITFSRQDGAGIGLIKKANQLRILNLEMAIISSEKNNVVKARADKLGIPCFQGIGDKFDFLSTGNSLPLESKATFDFADLIYLGNDLNDLSVMRAAGLSIAPFNAHPYVKAVSDKTFSQSGGEGFVRAAIEWLIGSAGLEAINEMYLR
jgi:3-deoxy-D-manno-octulosonate 8-phosphate phosphatase (KDO 8-P phosphatase)